MTGTDYSKNYVVKKEEIETTRSKLNKKLARLSLIDVNLARTRLEFQKNLRAGNFTRFPLFDQTHKELVIIDRLEKQLVRIKKRHNDKVDASIHLKGEIDKHRKSLKGLQDLFNRIEKNFDAFKRSHNFTGGNINRVEGAQRQINSLLKLRAQKRNEFESLYLKLLQENLNYQQELKKMKKAAVMNKDSHIVFQQNMNNLTIEQLSRLILDSSLENLNTRKVIKRIKNKIIDLENTINSIHLATGVTSIEEVIQSFKNVKKSNFNLLLLINSINTELNTLQIENNDMVKIVDEKKKEIKKRDHIFKESLRQQNLKLNDITKKISEEERKCDKLDDILSNIEKSLNSSITDLEIIIDNDGASIKYKKMIQGSKSTDSNPKSNTMEKIEEKFTDLIKLFETFQNSKSDLFLSEDNEGEKETGGYAEKSIDKSQNSDDSDYSIGELERDVSKIIESANFC